MGIRGRWLSGVLGLGLAALCWVLSPQSSVLSTPEPLPDPVPLRRILLPPERLPEEMRRLGQGLLKQLPREDFEDLVRRAAQAGEAAKKVPRLVEARYRARLTGGDLVGTAEWKVLNPAAGPAVLPLAGLNLALRNPRFANQGALVADLDGKGPGLLLEQDGENALALDWSARGEHRPEGLAFALEVPPAPIASLEVQAPADTAVAVASDGCLLTGPDPAEAPDQRLWTVQFGGRAQVRLVLRPAEGGGRPPLLLAALQTVQTITPDVVEASFTFDLQVLRPGTRELRCVCDPALRPWRVLFGRPSEEPARPLDSWRTVAGTGGAPGELLIRLPEPFQGGKVRVDALAPLGGSGGPVDWTCPGLRLERAVPRGETLELHLDPDVYPEQWNPGGFRLTESRPGDGGTQVLKLSGGGLASGPGLQRPSARLRTAGVDYRARQLTWWRLAPAGPGDADPAGGPPALEVRLTYDVLRGSLFQLPLALPPGWDVDRLQLNPPDLLRNSAVRRDGGRNVLLVDLQRPVPASPPPKADAPRAAGPLQLTVSLRPAPGSAPPDRPAPAGLSYPFPDVVPLGARLREGALAIDYDETAYEARPNTRAVATAPDEDGPWGNQVPDYYYPYRGQPVRGTITLLPRRPRVRARCTSVVGLTADRAAVETRLTLWPQVGTPDAVDVYVSAPNGDRYVWRTEEGTNAVRSFDRQRAAEDVTWLGPVGVRRPLEAVCLLAALARPAAGPRGERYRLALKRPLREPVTLVGTWELPRDGGRDAAGVAVPLLSVPGAARMEGEVRLYLAGANPVRVEAVGLREPQAPAGPHGNAPPPWRVFRYSQPPLALTLRGGGAAGDLAPRPVLDDARLTAYAGPDGPLQVDYRFDAWDWPQPTLPLRLPAGARLLRARVDGRWLAQLPADVPAANDAGVELPVPAGAARHRLEVVYAVDRPGWLLAARLEAPEPGLPLELRPRSFRRSWRLAPGVAPLFAAQDRLPGPARPPDTPTAWGQWAEELGERWGPREWLRRLALAHAGPDDGQAEQRLEQAADAATKAGPDRPRSLGEALGRLVLDPAQEPGVLVLDVEALRQAGLGPSSPLPAPPAEGTPARPFWEQVGLVQLPCEAAPLLTTRGQAEAWQYAARPGTALSPSLARAVAEAVLFGHDRSGRFAAVVDWLEEKDEGGGMKEESDRHFADSSFIPPPSSFPLVPEPVGRDWTAWEPLAGTPDDGTLVVVRQDTLPWWGGTLALLLAAAWWGVRRWPATRRALLLLGWVAAAGLGLLWLPPAVQALAWWPLLAGLLVAAGWYVRRALRCRDVVRAAEERGAKRPARSSLVLARPSLLLLSLGLSAAAWLLPGVGFRAAGPEPATVFLVPGAGAPEKGSVLAPPELLTQLQALAQRGNPLPHTPVLVSAEYRGEVKAEEPETAAFEAAFAVRAFADEAAPVALPLAGVQLEEVLVDGAGAAPVPGAGGTGYAVPVKGRGDHTVTVRFRVPVQAAGADRDLQCTVPRLLQSRLTLTVPSGARYLQVPVRQGATTPDPAGNRIEVELGQLTAPLHVRWREEAGPPRAPALKVEELYLWDLSVSASTLTAVLKYTVQQGAATSLEVDLPASLEVRGADVAPVGTEEPRPRLRDVHDPGPSAGAGHRRVRLDLASPVTTGVQVLLDLVPRRPLDAREALPVPAPVGAERTPGHLAYRLDGLTGGVIDSRRLGPVDTTRFTARWHDVRGTTLPSVSYACTFIRDPALWVDLEVRRPDFDARQDLAWRLGPQQADLRATLRLTAAAGDLGVVEWDVPESITVARVTGPDVRHWERVGRQLQVWLQRSVSDTELQLTGWWQPPAGRRPAAGQAPPASDLPRLSVPAAAEHTTYVRVAPAGGLALVPVRTRGLRALPEVGPPEQGREYWARTEDYVGSFRVRPALAAADVQVLTRAEVRDRRLVFTAEIDCRPRQGELRTLEVRLRNWDGDPAVLGEAPEIAQTRERPREDAGRSWTVDLRPGVTGRCRLTLTGSMALDAAAAGIPMPDVTVPGASRSERWLEVVGPGLTGQEAHGVTPDKGPGGALARAVRGSSGTVWKVTAADDDWGLRLVPGEREAGPGQVFLTEQTARVTDGQHWVHEATYWLAPEGGPDLGVVLPDGAEVLGAAVDGADVTPLQPGAGAAALWLPLPGGAGVRRVCLRWAFRGGETLDRPNLERPRLRGVTDGPVVWQVAVPAGYALGGPGRDGPRPASRAGVELRRAEAQLRLSEALAARAGGRGDAFTGQLAAAQQRFYQACRDAGHWLATAGIRPALLRSSALGNDMPLAGRAVVADVGPGGQSLADWLQELEKQNAQLARDTPGLDALRAEAKRRAGAPPAAEHPDPVGRCAEGDEPRGTPLYWQATDPASPAPAVRLTAVQTQQTRRALGASLLLAALLLAGWLLAAFPGAVPGLRGRWPEQAALVGGVAWLVFGFNVLGAFLVLLGVAGRLLYLAGRAWAWLRPAAPAPESGAGSA